MVESPWRYDYRHKTIAHNRIGPGIEFSLLNPDLFVFLCPRKSKTGKSDRICSGICTLAGCVSSLVTTVAVVVVNESLDSKEQVRAVFLRPDANGVF